MGSSSSEEEEEERTDSDAEEPPPRAETAGRGGRRGRQRGGEAAAAAPAGGSGPAADGGRMVKRREGLSISGDQTEAPPLQEEARNKVRQAIVVSFGPQDPRGQEMLLMLQFVQTLQDLQMFTEKYADDLVRPCCCLSMPHARARMLLTRVAARRRAIYPKFRSTCS